MLRMRVNDGAPAGCTCGCWCGLLIFNLLLGGVTLNYTLMSIIGKSIPFGYAVVAGLFIGQFTVPAAVVCWVLRLAGMEVPFVK